MNLYIPEKFKNNEVREVTLTEEDLINFELRVKEEYEKATITGPVHMSKGNEKQLIEIFKFIHPEDWVFSSWRNHYHALLHGVPEEHLWDLIVSGKSMSVYCKEPKLYTSSIVGGIIPIALGAAKAQKMKKNGRKVWAFVGDMTAETGVFHEAYKYSRRHELPLEFVIEDNDMSTNTPTSETWNGVKSQINKDIFYYFYERGYPHHGTGQWILF
jgi:TPP-dependent pyruvate/acetoin dehydrogenase alpha subunit|tara:strand:+ start:1160 stop:1801 length:642 start_codon:yes stop_codon:yes gene_type:complete